MTLGRVPRGLFSSKQNCTSKLELYHKYGYVCRFLAAKQMERYNYYRAIVERCHFWTEYYKRFPEMEGFVLVGSAIVSVFVLGRSMEKKKLNEFLKTIKGK